MALAVVNTASHTHK
uniref:Uncharacterized protein n=1 Tax=Anguilla anguilla TaxID=7936 RepID=A0A0E9SB04_ANGAN